jgi:RNA recognition motif-containing protein
MNIYVGNLPFNIGEEDLKGIFEEYGEVSTAKIITDKITGRGKGFGFVEMEDDEEAKTAIEELNNAEVGGRNIKVNESVPRPAGGGGERRGGGGGDRRGGGGDRRGGGGGGFNRRERY